MEYKVAEKHAFLSEYPNGAFTTFVMKWYMWFFNKKSMIAKDCILFMDVLWPFYKVGRPISLSPLTLVLTTRVCEPPLHATKCCNFNLRDLGPHFKEY